MNFSMTWDDDAETIVRIDITGGVGLLDYIVPMNEAAGLAMIADGQVAVIVNMGMTIPYPARPFPRVRDALMGAPRNIDAIVLASGNPLTRLTTRIMLLNPYRELSAKVHLVDSLAAARQLVAQQRRTH
jgi:hypothetical protein